MCVDEHMLLGITMSQSYLTPDGPHTVVRPSKSTSYVSNKYKKLGYLRDTACRRSFRRSRSFKVTDFGTNRKL